MSGGKDSYLKRAARAALFVLSLSSAVLAQQLPSGTSPPGPDPRQYTDPSLLTTQMLDRGLVNLDARISTRLDSIQRAIDVAHDDLTRVPTTLQTGLLSLRELEEQRIEKLALQTAEQFARVSGQFDERDKRTEAANIASSTAIAAALQAQKEAVADQNKFASAVTDKSEKALLDALAQQRTLSQAEITALSNELNDVKSRLDRSEGQGGGATGAVNWALAAIAAVAAIVAMGSMLFPHRNQVVVARGAARRGELEE